MIALVMAAGGAAGAALYLGLVRPALGDRELELARVHARASPAMERRVLVLGDSFLDRWPLEQSLHSALLRHCVERRVGLINTASPGIGPVEYRRRLELLAGRYRPTLVLLFYHVGNDLTDTLYRVNDIPQPMGTPRHEVKWDWGGFYDNGVAPDLVDRARRGGGWWSRLDDEFVNPFLLATALEYPRLYIEGTLVESAAARGAWDKNARLLAETFRLARGVGARIQVIAIPSVAQMGPRQRHFLRQATFQLTPAVATSRRPQELLARLCQAHGVPLLDLLGPFLAHPERDRLFLARDDHFSARGHRLAFELLRRRVLEPGR